jgi:2-hydroxychromene-2-carboxylate isomerase
MNIDFWFEFGSTYSYPAAMRVEKLVSQHDVGVSWRPFLLGAIFREQGLADSPLTLYPAKGRYMWHDLERTARNLKWGPRAPIIGFQQKVRDAHRVRQDYAASEFLTILSAVYCLLVSRVSGQRRYRRV